MNIIEAVCTRIAKTYMEYGDTGLAVDCMYDLLTNPSLGPGGPVIDNPGVYSDRGLALFFRDGNLFFALEPSRFLRWSESQHKRRGNTVPVKMLPEELAQLFDLHPLFYGMIEGDPLPDGKWHAIIMPSKDTAARTLRERRA